MTIGNIGQCAPSTIDFISVGLIECQCHPEPHTRRASLDVWEDTGKNVTAKYTFGKPSCCDSLPKLARCLAPEAPVCVFLVDSKNFVDTEPQDTNGRCWALRNVHRVWKDVSPYEERSRIASFVVSCQGEVVGCDDNRRRAWECDCEYIGKCTTDQLRLVRARERGGHRDTGASASCR